jgi:ABC-type nitrate/sulfonate/bicarbonate transport system substrate-binding protein
MFRSIAFAAVLAFVAGLAAAPEVRAQAKPATTVRVAVMPVTNFTPLVVARDKGWFAEEGLNVTWTPVAQGAIAVEAVFGGSAEFGGGSVFEPMVARGNGLDIVFVVPNTRINPTPPDNSALLVRTKDAIQKPADLVGKKISAGLVNSINYIHMMEWLQKRNVDPKSIQFLEIPFPQQADALFQNRLDAVWAVEPFMTFMLKSGNARILAMPYQDNMPGMDITALIAKESWVKQNADTARGFKRAMERATAHLKNASKEERDGWVSKYTGVKPEVVAQMTLPDFITEFNVGSLKANLDLAAKHKVAKPFDINRMIWK